MGSLWDPLRALAPLAALRTLDRRTQLTAARLSTCASVSSGVGAIVVLALAIGGGCGPKTPARTAPAASGGEIAGGPEAPVTTQPDGTPRPPPPPLGRPAKLTLYFLATQPCPDTPQIALKTCEGGTIATVSTHFRKSAAMQGSAKLCDGRVVNIRKVNPVCFTVLPEGNPWGMTASGRPATPFRSLATDPKHFATGKWYYAPELDGMPLPAPAEGKLHDGCVRADDIGGAVKGDMVDLFVGPHSAVEALKGRLSEAKLHLAEGGARCADPKPF